MKKILSALVILMLFISAFACASNEALAKKPSEYSIGTSYSSAVNSGKPAIVLVYADWCGSCNNYMPYFENLYRKYGSKYNFTMVNVDKDRNISSQFSSPYIPSVYIEDKKYKQKIYISSQYYRDDKAMSSRLDLYLKRRQEWANGK